MTTPTPVGTHDEVRRTYARMSEADRAKALAEAEDGCRDCRADGLCRNCHGLEDGDRNGCDYARAIVAIEDVEDSGEWDS